PVWPPPRHSAMAALTLSRCPNPDIAELRQRVEAGEQKTKLAREFGISRETLYQYLRTDQ
ncbi:helix-turn-helix domain-containing protein, partial [Pseudomonas aeruginosa]|uniref:helix-turn-helix domain-containing protein n=1 Tax=Pseudomonas aeruginosa TaxID=287 RepID=UPI003969557D